MLDLMPTESSSDAQLVLRSSAGDRRAFDLLAGRCGQPLFHFLVTFVGDREEARDVCQEALLKAFANIARLRAPERFRPWLHQIAVNLCRDRGRGRRVALVALDGDDESMARELPAAAPSPLDLAQRAELRQRLATLLARLPAEQRSAILLAELHGFTSVEIAAITGVPAATVRSRVFHGLKALRRMLPESGIDHDHLHALEVQP